MGSTQIENVDYRHSFAFIGVMGFQSSREIRGKDIKEDA